MYFPYFENFVVNLPAALRAAMRAGWIGTNYIVNPAERDRELPRICFDRCQIWRFDYLRK